MGEPRGRGRKSSLGAAMRGARDFYVRWLRGLDRLLAAASPRRGGVGRPSSRVFGAGRDSSEEDLREVVRAMQARRAAAASTGGAAARSAGKVEVRAPAVMTDRRRGATQLERINEDAAVVHPITC